MTESKPPADQDDAPDPNELLSKNLGMILGDRTPEAYCKEKKPHYVSGTKRGKKVAPRTLRSVLSGEYSPRLDFLAAIAWVEQLEVYQLMFYDFDPTNAPVMISRHQEELLDSIQRASRELPQTKVTR